MIRINIFFACLVLLLACQKDDGPSMTHYEGDIQYLAFQLFVSGTMEPLTDFGALRDFRPDTEIEDFYALVASEVGTSEVPHRKSAVMIGPLALDFSDEETSRLIDLSFALAIEYDVAVGFHIDDGMYWGRRADLWQNRDNIEWQDWEQTPSSSRYVDWVQARLAPHMCFNCPEVMNAVASFMTNIAQSIKRNYDLLRKNGREDLYAGTIIGWETSLDRERDSQLPLGFHAMANLGYNRSNPPVDPDAVRVQIVKDYIEFMAAPLSDAELPSDKSYSHIAFISKTLYNYYSGINPAFGAQSYEMVNNFSPPEITLGSNLRAGFSTYYEEGRFKQIYDLENGTIQGWACAEGTNIILNMPPEETGFSMESYLARHYNHGANLVNIFAFNIPGIDPFNQALREASEGPDAITAYQKFLSGAALKE